MCSPIDAGVLLNPGQTLTILSMTEWPVGVEVVTLVLPTWEPNSLYNTTGFVCPGVAMSVSLTREATSQNLWWHSQLKKVQPKFQFQKYSDVPELRLEKESKNIFLLKLYRQ